MYELIKSRFGKAAKYYDNNAVAQKIISDKLFSLIENTVKPQNILEIGCGTGNLSKRLLELSPEKLVLNDICPGYVSALEKKLGHKIVTENGTDEMGCSNPESLPHITFYCKNAQELNENEFTSKFNLIASASAIQWMQNPLRFIIDCKKLMDDDGIAAISTFAPDNMCEVTSISGSGLKYSTLQEIRSALEKHYEILHLSAGEITLTFKEPVDILRHIKLTGTNGTNAAGWTKRDLEYFTEQYGNRYRSIDGSYPLTYKPVFIICRNPGKKQFLNPKNNI